MLVEAVAILIQALAQAILAPGFDRVNLCQALQLTLPASEAAKQSPMEPSQQSPIPQDSMKQEKMSTAAGGTKHIGAMPGDFAEICLVPGDPLRAKVIAETYLQDVQLVSTVRNMLAFTGNYKGVRVSVMGTGMGLASNAIYYQELVTHYGVKKLIRVGSCGTHLYPEVQLGDLVVGIGAGTDSNMNRMKFANLDFAATADYDLLEQAVKACKGHPNLVRGVRAPAHSPNGPKSTSGGSLDRPAMAAANKHAYHVAKIFSSDFFYHPQERTVYPLLKKFGFAAIEMEAAILYSIGAEFGAQTLAVCTVTDELRLPDDYASNRDSQIEFTGMEASQREKSLQTMMQVALDAAISDEVGM